MPIIMYRVELSIVILINVILIFDASILILIDL
jgi:hypothetical protein